MASKRPPIPDRYSSLISPQNRQQLAVIKQRVSSFESQRSVATNCSDFLEAHIQCVETELDYLNKSRLYLKESLESNAIKQPIWEDVMSGANSDKERIEGEYIQLKKQKKSIQEDMEEGLEKPTMEAAYISILRDKVMLASSENQQLRSKERKKFDQSKFKKNVIEYYGARRDDGCLYCPLTAAWHPEAFVKAAHIVPKCLESEDLSYVFGVGDLMLQEPRNALPLLRTLEEGLDAGKIVIVPVPPKECGEPTRWVCLLIDQSSSNKPFSSTHQKWKDIDGKVLSFLNEKRPARRYLYFKYAMTYLWWQKKGDNMMWRERVEARGYYWATPDKLLRKTMMVNIARRISDPRGPEDFWESNTFDSTEGCPARSPDQENVSAMRLAKLVNEEMEPNEVDEDEDEPVVDWDEEEGEEEEVE